jgi:hypothetical protein
MGRWVGTAARGITLAAVLVGACAPAASAAAHPSAPQRAAAREPHQSPSPTLTLSAAAPTASSGALITLTGTATGAPAGSTVQLAASPYPFSSSAPVASATPDPSTGAFSFRVTLQTSTRYTASIRGVASSPTIQVDALGRTLTTVSALTLGRARVTILVFHPSQLRWSGVRVRWWFATGRGRFDMVRTSVARRLSRYVIVLRTSITLPAGRFRWRVCFDPPLAGALLNPRRPPGCRGRGYHGAGSLPVGYPGPAAIARAARYLRGRIGRTAFAVIDSEGRLSGVHLHWRFVSASVVKAMLLVAYLRMLAARGQHHVDGYSNSILYPMINVSDNNAATQCWSIVGDGRLYALARAAHMTDFQIVGIWANAQISAADQARFFFEMDSLIPPEFVGYANHLLSTIAAYESWGIPAIARPLGYQVYFKGGWRPTVLGQLVHQIARLQGHGRTFALAVMTDGDPSMGYGIDTIQGLTRALL